MDMPVCDRTFDVSSDISKQSRMLTLPLQIQKEARLCDTSENVFCKNVSLQQKYIWNGAKHEQKCWDGWVGGIRREVL